MIGKLSLLITLCLCGFGYAQQYSSSPFSAQGIGEAGGLEDAIFGGVGTCRTAVIDSSILNLYNPASYTSTIKDQPLFGIGLSGRYSNYSVGDVTSKGRVTGLSHIGMAIPMGKRFGMALALQPFSRKGYAIEQKEFDGTDSIRYGYIGSGGTNEVLGGVAYNILKSKRHDLAIGVNYSYIFGSVTNERRSSFIAYEPVGGVDQTNYRLHAWRYSVGINYRLGLDTIGNKSLGLSAVISPQQQLSAHRDYYLYATTDISNPNVYDTIVATQDDKGNLMYPTSMSFGFDYSFRPKAEGYKHRDIYQMHIFGEFSSVSWSTYKAEFSQTHENSLYRDAYRFSLGAQFTPSYKTVSKASGKGYFKRVKYRAGAYYGTLPNVENNTQLNVYGATLGFGLPASSQKNNSSFNISVQYGVRGNGEATGLKEQFLGVNFGVILAPSYDKWFRKYKLD